MVSAADKMTAFNTLFIIARGVNNVPRATFFSCLVVFFVAISFAQDGNKSGSTTALFNGKNLDGWKVTDFGGEGEVRVEDGQIIMRMGQPLTGVTWTDASKIPTDNFEVSLQAMKRTG